ncbi:MAG TPA: VWA domain-containing protein [Flavisolibacter sp.]|nr:VWA domain-containing protein [Flavisolibacter sp.]
MQFQYPEAFWLLALIPIFVILFVYYRHWQFRTKKKLGDKKLIADLFADYSNTKAIIKFCLIIIAFALGCVAIANPRKPDESSADARKGIDIVLALDVSNSMLATDIQPSRLIRAKQFINKLMDNLQDDRVGLVVFAGNAYIQMPLSFDFDAARMFISTAAPGTITAQGTSIGDALIKGNLLFNEQSDRFKSIILITDGETHDENALETAKEMAKKGIMINTVGIGSADGSTIIDSSGSAKKDASGQIIVTKLNEQLLQQIASITNGKYSHLENTDAPVPDVLNQYKEIDKKALGDFSLYNYVSFYEWLIIPMVILLIMELFFPDRKMSVQ